LPTFSDAGVADYRAFRSYPYCEKPMTRSKIEIHGYAIVSDDDRIADSSGMTPLSLRNDADWAYFQQGLDQADFVVLGRLGHEANPNLRQRRRLVLSGAAQGLEERSDAWWWNPQRLSWSDAVETLLPRGGRVAVPGGQAVFDLFMTLGYEAFHLSRARGVRLPGGRYLFAACENGRTAESVLQAAGLIAGEVRLLDAAADVTIEIWRGP
jgi:hypothetical protein